MTRDTVKTLAGLIIIGGIVVATFLYGNAQRQAQLSHDQEVKKQQEAKVAAATTSPTASVQAPAAAKANNTAPVTSPASNAIQGSSTASPTPAASPSPTPAAGSVAGASTAVTTVPVTGGSGANLPETGPETIGLLGLGSMSAMVLAVRRSKQAMLKAARGQRKLG